MNTKLENCPWCRNPESDRDVMFEDLTVFGETYRAWFGECECGARGPHADSAELAIIEYNAWTMNRAV